jgi:hypothetical protein
MGGKGVTLGTDINGFEAQLNPRFGSMGCYARGNIPRIVQFAYDGRVIIDNHYVDSVTPRTEYSEPTKQKSRPSSVMKRMACRACQPGRRRLLRDRCARG